MESTESVAVASDAVRHHEKFPEDQVRPVDRAGKNRLHGAALFFAGGQVHRGIHRAGHAHQDHQVGNQSTVGFAGDFLIRDHILLLDVERLHQAFGQTGRTRGGSRTMVSRYSVKSFSMRVAPSMDFKSSLKI